VRPICAIKNLQKLDHKNVIKHENRGLPPRFSHNPQVPPQKNLKMTAHHLFTLGFINATFPGLSYNRIKFNGLDVLISLYSMKNPSALFKHASSASFAKNVTNALDLNDYFYESMSRVMPNDYLLEMLAKGEIRNMIDSGIAFPNIVKALWYSRLPCYEVEGMTGTFKSESSILKDCLWKGKKVKKGFISLMVSLT
jgi:hypothetical protein